PADDPVTISMLDELTDPAPDRREQTRSLRPYRPGDPRRMVHWAATARHGELLVRELEGTTSREVRIGLELISGTAASAHAVQRCAALVTAARHRGDRISLATVETDEPTVSPVVVAPRAATRYVSRIPSITRVVERPVTGPEDLLSRLARAVPGRLDSVSGPMFVLGELESGWRR
ncbi:MAG: DUF58 domain-containing protein, partial [Acidimicrobiia bacterium]|nr:DUF58 domain-containing protein [Acidimicrobiia bacterium]